MYKEKKIPFFVRLPESLVKKFREYTNLKYSSDRYGWQSHEVELALMRYLAAQHTHQQSAQTNYPRESKTLKIKNSMDEIKNYLIKSELYLEVPRYIPEKHLDQAILNLHGFDPRTIKKWKDLLEKYGQIRRNGSFQFEILT